jgi:two-component system osmolarity sensor histidine kinase EnvZ
VILNRPAKRLLPRSLLGRLLLIMLAPLLVLQGVALQIFYGSHLDLVSRRLSSAVAGEIAVTIVQLDRWPDERDWLLRQAHEHYDLAMRYEPGKLLAARRSSNILGPMDDDLREAMQQKIDRPFTMDWTSDPRVVLLRVQLQDGVLDVQAPRKRLDTGTIYLFLFWLVGIAALMFGVAAWFVRNQVRSIRRLARAAEAFGMGNDPGAIKPEGAVEVRRAATAFNRMQERIRRFLGQRTEMLAGVSHDLRTPLTRLRLAIAMLPPHPDLAGMTEDVDEMERMISGYLAFARGEVSEPAQAVLLAGLLEEVAEGARRAGAKVTLDVPGGLTVQLRRDAARRAIANLVDNARRHARHVGLSAEASARAVWVMVDDDGPGIPVDQRESVFRPFESGAAGGTGLGLTIARDVIRAHGGDITLEDSPLGGLRARVRLPVQAT